MAQSWPTGDAIAFGGDYNPEQWPRDVWHEDVALMRAAGVNLVSVGIFSWARIEVSEGVFDFGWLDDVLDLLHANGIAVDLGTPTAAPPAWFYANYPEARVVTRDGVTLGFGSRGAVSPSAPAYREAVARIAGALAQRYADHPAVVLWHVHNEYGAPVGEDFSPAAVAAFREWLQERYGSLEGLNAAWGTAFWGQHYTAWEHVGAPAATASVANPAQRLDFARFTDHQLRACFVIERDAIRAHATQPITTNFMATECPTTDLWAWAGEVDLVSNDHYLTAADERGFVGLAMAADLTRSVAGNRPWLLLEHSTSAVNWQPRNVAKRPGEMARNAMSHLGRGADAIMFFQWRASRSGAEKFHSAMLPHAGTDSRVWREVVELGGALERLAPVVGSQVRADVAILWDTESFWAQDLEWRPSVDARHRERVRAYYERLWRDGRTVDFVQPSADLSGYRLVVAPASYLLRLADAANLDRYVAAGGTLLVSYFSAIVDETDAVHVGGFGAPLRDVLGLTVEEFQPLRAGEHAAVAWGDELLASDVWQEDIKLAGAQVVARNVGGPAAGGPAVTRNEHGDGAAWYVATRLGIDALAPVLEAVYADAGLTPTNLPSDVEVITRHGDDADFVVAINHTAEDVKLDLGDGQELLAATSVTGALDLAAGATAVLRTDQRPGGDRPV
ncbi:beta-galactosidase [Cellulomonas composti]|uniref:Beta-galactosidase n=1 Tax=Cellulomonas composti TaxID=266130 RepID=A0A511JC53_9CELL|nr:beta-galactosidase [Cellulomonas composti]GEL95574.1 beta-galactosidase [Cellulomonas composti]